MPLFPLKAAVIAAPCSGSGKTLITRSLAEAFSRNNFLVQTFKTGPDYIDSAHLAAASTRPCHNLDLWLMGEDACRDVFWQNTELATQKPHLALIEGVMGLYDGLGSSSISSTAHLASVLNLPIILVVNAKGMGHSIAALVKGFLEFEGAPLCAGLIINETGSPNHNQLIEESLKKALGERMPPILGFIPKSEKMFVPAKHLGLIPPQELSKSEKENISEAVTLVSACINLENFINVLPSLNEAPHPLLPKRNILCSPSTKKLKLAVAKDEAFNFYYEENLRMLQEHGFELLFFSPLREATLPKDTAGIYIGGGYPEAWGEKLAQNASLLANIRGLAQNGCPILAEGGGYAYLAKELVMPSGEAYSLTGCLPTVVEFSTKRQGIGYRSACTHAASCLGPAKTTFRGHELHYYKIKSHAANVSDSPISGNTLTSGNTGNTGISGNAGNASRQLELIDSAKRKTSCGMFYKNIAASFLHIHFASQPNIVKNFYNACYDFKKSNDQRN